MMVTTFKHLYTLIRTTISEFMSDKVLKLSAALAYYTVFSLPPLLILIIVFCGEFLGREAIEGQIFGQINNLVGNNAALQIQEVIRNIHLENEGFIATVSGIFVLILSATGIFGEIQDSINQIWGLKAKPRRGFFKLIINRLLSFSLIVSLGFALMVSLVINAFLGYFSEALKRLLPDTTVYLMMAIDQAIIFAVTTFLFAVIFRVLPDARIKWKDVWIGAMVTSVLFMVGKFLIGYYLGNNSTVTAYGAAGSLVLILLWVYYSSLILYFGAEFTQVYASMAGRHIQPNKYAVWVDKVEIEKDSNAD